MLPCRTHCPRPSMCIMYGCGTACGTTLFARYCLVTPRQKPPEVGFGAPGGGLVTVRRRAPCAPVWAFGTIPTARDMPVACFARWYTWLRPEAASLELSRWRSAGHLGAISTSATASHRSPCFGTIRLWYDIAVFVAVLSFHSARYRSDYGPRRPFEARVISARSRPPGSRASVTPITVRVALV